MLCAVAGSVLAAALAGPWCLHREGVHGRRSIHRHGAALAALGCAGLGWLPSFSRGGRTQHSLVERLSVVPST